jgi:uncharacterized protein YbjT (DUF2867 family)
MRSLSVVMLGASGAVGGHVVRRLAEFEGLRRLTLLVRRPLTPLLNSAITQHIVDVMNPASYRSHLPGHDAAVCTLGMGQPSKFSKEEFVRVDKDAVLAFASACKEAQVRHFELLSAVGANSKSRFFYLRIKGELEDGLRSIGFERLSLFEPSMILTPTNRYGISQAIVLKVWPVINPLLVGSLRRSRGIPVEALGTAMANNLLTSKRGVETLHWDDFMALSNTSRR